jgi:hypothetical protein
MEASRGKGERCQTLAPAVNERLRPRAGLGRREPQEMPVGD